MDTIALRLHPIRFAIAGIAMSVVLNNMTIVRTSDSCKTRPCLAIVGLHASGALSEEQLGRFTKKHKTNY
jgi:hypothetical protein